MDGSFLPSLESFQMRSKMPKVYYVFYEHFFKAVVSDGIWKRHFNESRFGTNVLEASTHLCLQNNYFAWLYDYKVSHPNSTLKAEYDLANKEPSDTEGLSDDNTDAPQIFCGDLD